MRPFLRSISASFGLCLFTVGVGFPLAAGAQSAPDLRLPPAAVALQGVPDVQIETTREGATRRQLDAAAAEKHPLNIRLADGRFYRAGEREPLVVSAAGAFTYLLSREPGHYVRIRRVNDKLEYVEHLDTAIGSVTYWGELRVVLGK